MKRLLRLVGWVAAGLHFSATAALICQFCVQWTVVQGTAPAAVMALLLSLAGGMLIAAFAAPRLRGSSPADRTAELTTNVSMTVVVIFLSWCASQLFSTSAEMGAALVSGQNAIAFLPSVLMMTMATATTLLWDQLQTARTVDGSRIGYGWIAAGILAMLLHSQFVQPIAVTTTILVALTAIGGMTTLLVTNTAAANQSDESPFRTSANHVPQSPDWFKFTTAAASGIIVVGVTEFAIRMFPGTVTIFLIAAALTAMGCWCTTWISCKLPTSLFALTPLCWLAAGSLPILFSTLVESNLKWNSTVGSPWLLLLMRASQIAAFAVPALTPLAILLLPMNRGERFRVSATAVGVAASASWTAAVGLRPVSLFAAGIAVAVISTTFAAAGGFGLTSRQRQRKFLGQGLLATGTIVVALSGTLDSSQSAQLLFSERSVAAIQRGVDRTMIQQSDSTRLVAAEQTPSGDVTVWRRSGYLFEFRRNGVLMGRVSSDTRLCPQPAEDMLVAVLPMVLHPTPGQILLLGDETGACLRSCASFPVQHITAVRSDDVITELARRFTWQRLQVPPDQDDRVTIANGTPAQALRSTWPNQFDVVISDSGDAATAAASPEFTREYYQAAQRQLAAGGVFCQRFRQQSYGPEPLRHALATLGETFAHAAAIQTVPGEIVLVATDAEAGLLDDQVLARLQRSHVRREIAAAGWDWCQVAALTMVDVRDPIGIFSEQKPPTAISVANSWFALSLPVESVRWGNKSAEYAVTIAPHLTVLAENVTPSEDHREANRRISALAQETEILCGIPDQPFFYRKSLRTELERNPRPPQEVIRNGKVTRKAHPLDKLRRDYFVALGEAIQATYQGQHQDAALQRLSQFTRACEPLLSTFAHHELIRLHEMAGHPDAETEFQHRMHVVYFAQQADASVRPVIAALQQLADQPDLIEGEAERFDHLNSMLQKLIERWEARTAWEPRSAIRVQNDVDQSIRVTNRALERMETLAAAAGVSHHEFLQRRRFINAALIGPLRDYREDVLAHRARTEDQEKANSTVDDGSDLPLLLPQTTLNTN
jgi:spermidine synthase